MGYNPNPTDYSIPPTQQVLQLREEGLTNNQIIQNLQRAGFDNNLIFEALYHADIKGNITPTPLNKEEMNIMNPMQPNFQQNQQNPPQFSQGTGNVSREQIEEITESIIDERWEEIVDNIKKVIEWKDGVEKRISVIEEQIKKITSDFDKLHTSILEKVGEYDSNINRVATNVKALEHVFGKMLPGFIENVSELGRITQKMKKGAGESKK